jgi:hypothetical protein
MFNRKDTSRSRHKAFDHGDNQMAVVIEMIENLEKAGFDVLDEKNSICMDYFIDSYGKDRK